MSAWLPVFIALFVWWFSTGTILMAVKRADRAGQSARRWIVLIGLPMALAGLVGIWWSLTRETVTGAYVAFLSALAVWGWIELAFLTGNITGPKPHPLPPQATGWPRFVAAWGAIAYHELLLTLALIGLGILTLGAENSFAFWTFAILWGARISAKLNLFFGVPRINVEFLPQALAHLPSYFGPAKASWFFPVSVTALTFAAACWIERLYAAQTDGTTTGFALLTALTALALLEHWVMVLPIPDDRLWRWMLPADTATPQTPRKTTKTGEQHGL
jgi:putative photosynthetic complex assembly protein 2